MGRQGVAKKWALSWDTDPEAAGVLAQCSKAALLDLALELIHQDGLRGADEPVSASRALHHLAPVLARRGDPMPKVRP